MLAATGTSRPAAGLPEQPAAQDRPFEPNSCPLLSFQELTRLKMAAGESGNGSLGFPRCFNSRNRICDTTPDNPIRLGSVPAELRLPGVDRVDADPGDD